MKSNGTEIPDPEELARKIKFKRDLQTLAAILLHKKPKDGAE